MVGHLSMRFFLICIVLALFPSALAVLWLTWWFGAFVSSSRQDILLDHLKENHMDD
jgi:hypothetical protein